MLEAPAPQTWNEVRDAKHLVVSSVLCVSVSDIMHASRRNLRRKYASSRAQTSGLVHVSRGYEVVV